MALCVLKARLLSFVFVKHSLLKSRFLVWCVIFASLGWVFSLISFAALPFSKVAKLLISVAPTVSGSNKSVNRTGNGAHNYSLVFK